MKKAAKMPSAHGHEQDGTANLSSSWSRKNEVNVQKRGSLYFQIGLILAMGIVFTSLEASFATNNKDEFKDLRKVDREPFLIVQDVPLVKEEKLTPKKERKTVIDPRVIVIDEPSDPIEVIYKEEAATLSLDSISYDDPTKDEPPTILIELVDEVPIFPGCEEVDKTAQLACFNEMMKAHIKKHFKYPEAALNLGIEGRVSINFTIDQKGVISSVQMRGPSTILEKEAERIILKLPVMTPGKQKGKAVKVPYSIPINFLLK